MADVDVSILIPTHNRCQILARTLESLSQISIPGGTRAELIVVANACTDETEQVVSQFAAQLQMPCRCVAEPEPGLNIARNRAIEEGRGDILAFLDDDVWVDPGWLCGLRNGFENYGADVVGGRVVLWWEVVEKPEWCTKNMTAFLSEYDKGENVKPDSRPIGANFAFRRAVVAKIGAFKPHLDRNKKMLLGGGDTDFAMRADEAGFSMYYVPDALVKHWVAPHRATTEYIMGVASGLGISQVLMKRPQSARAVVRTLAGRLWLVVKHESLEIVSRLTKRTQSAVYHAAMVRIGWGGLKGLWIRYVKKGKV